MRRRNICRQITKKSIAFYRYCDPTHWYKNEACVSINKTHDNDSHPIIFFDLPLPYVRMSSSRLIRKHHHRHNNNNNNSNNNNNNNSNDQTPLIPSPMTTSITTIRQRRRLCRDHFTFLRIVVFCFVALFFVGGLYFSPLVPFMYDTNHPNNDHPQPQQQQPPHVMPHEEDVTTMNHHTTFLSPLLSSSSRMQQDNHHKNVNIMNDNNDNKINVTKSVTHISRPCIPLFSNTAATLGGDQPRPRRRRRRRRRPFGSTHDDHSLLLLDPWFTVHQQTICHDQSAFRNTLHPEQLSDHDWQVRLLYMGMYLHQHLPAWEAWQAIILARRRQDETNNDTSAITRSNNNNNNEQEEDCQEEQRQQPSSPASSSSSNKMRGTNENQNDDTITNSSSSDHPYYTTTCPASTRYLVASLPTTSGTGATFRSAAVAALLAGVATNRVVLFVNHRSFGSPQMQAHWTLASCRPRGDYTCYFLPITSCVLSEEELQQAIAETSSSSSSSNNNSSNVVSLPDVGQVLNHGGGSRAVRKRRILVVDAVAKPLQLTAVTEKQIRRRIHDLIQQNEILMTQHPPPPRHVMEEALLMPYERYDELLLRKEEEEQKTRRINATSLHPNASIIPSSPVVVPYKFHHATSTLHHAALLYLLRPNEQFGKRLDQEVRQVIPSDFDPEWSFGVPIRGKKYVIC